jgi:hypothetical protein
MFIGITLATLVWAANFLVQGQFIEAVNGHVEDAHGLFWGFFNIGAVAGILVGAFWAVQTVCGPARESGEG